MECKLKKGNTEIYIDHITKKKLICKDKYPL